MSLSLKIDPEFQNKIPPLTEEEYSQLEENILSAGKVFEPIVIWNDTIVDGHNRYKIILEHPYVEWSVRKMDFADKWEAIAWMCANQLGRRNIQDPFTIKMLKGMMYEARKQTHGGDRRSDNFSSDQNDHLKTGRNKNTAQKVAEELHTNEIDIRRAGEFYRGMTAIEEADPVLATEIKAHKKPVSGADIMRIGKARPEVREQMIDSIRNGEKKKITKAETKELNGIVDTISDENIMEFTVEHLTDQIRFNSDAFIRSLSNLLMDHTDICNEHQAEIIKAIDENIVARINQIKETLSNGTQL